MHEGYPGSVSVMVKAFPCCAHFAESVDSIGMKLKDFMPDEEVCLGLSVCYAKCRIQPPGT